MSKIREQFPTPPAATRPLAVSRTGDLTPYVIFTQLKANGPYIYAGWLEAADNAMAMDFAKEHYGQDQECVNVIAIAREHITSSDGLFEATQLHDAPAATTFQHSQECENVVQDEVLDAGKTKYAVFTQKRAGDLWLSAGTVESAESHEAIETARKTIKQAASAHAVWVVDASCILSSNVDDLIWRHTDQSYRLARGYGREVRAKWIAIRDEKQLAEYERDDLQDAF